MSSDQQSRDEIARLRGALHAIAIEAVPGSTIASICYDALTDNDAVSFLAGALQDIAGTCTDIEARRRSDKLGTGSRS